MPRKPRDPFHYLGLRLYRQIRSEGINSRIPVFLVDKCGNEGLAKTIETAIGGHESLTAHLSCRRFLPAELRELVDQRLRR